MGGAESPTSRVIAVIENLYLVQIYADMGHAGTTWDVAGL